MGHLGVKQSENINLEECTQVNKINSTADRKSDSMGLLFYSLALLG